MKRRNTRVKIYRDAKGQFIRVTNKNGKKKKKYIKPGLSERELIKFLIQTLKPKRRKKKQSDSTPTLKKVDPISSSVIQLMNAKSNKEKEALNTIQQIRNEVKNLPLQAIAPAAPVVAITDGTKERKHPRYSEEDIEEGIRMLEKAQQKKEQYKKKALEEQKKVTEEKKKAVQKDYQTEFSKIKSKYTNLYIEGLYTGEKLRDLARQYKIATTGTKPDLIKKLMKANAFSAISQDTIDKGIAKKFPIFVDEVQDLKDKLSEELEDLDTEELDTSLITPVKPARSESSGSDAAAAARKARSPEDDAAPNLSPQSGEGGKSGGEGLSTSQLETLMKDYKGKGFLGVIPRDGIPSFYHQIKPQSRISWIMNTDSSKRSGKHWVSCYLDCRKNGSYSIEYYDPLGKLDRPWVRGEFLKMIRPMLTILNPDEYLSFKQNFIADQNINTQDCGYFAVKFLQDRYAGKSFKQASGFDHLGQDMIAKFKKKLGSHFPRLEYDSQTGEGVLRDVYEWGKDKVKRGVERVKEVLKGEIRLKFAPSIRRLLEKHGNQSIAELKIMRSPINSFINKALNWISLGKFEQNLKEAGYDSGMHLYMYIKLANGVMLRADKNHVIEMKQVSSWTPDTNNVEQMSVSSPKQTTLNEFLQKGIDSVGAERYFKYSSGSTNCQDWIKTNLSANNLWSSSIEKFVMQDVKKIYEGLGLLEQVNQRITDIAAKADVVLHGEGKKIKRRNKSSD